MDKLINILIQKGLSNREAEIAALVSRGMSSKEIANRFFILEKTVKWHLAFIYKKLHVKSRAQLIVSCLPYMESMVENDK
jgi:DNA-binding CsgD family transcriptional regulator